MARQARATALVTVQIPFAEKEKEAMIAKYLFSVKSTVKAAHWPCKHEHQEKDKFCSECGVEKIASHEQKQIVACEGVKINTADHLAILTQDYRDVSLDFYGRNLTINKYGFVIEVVKSVCRVNESYSHWPLDHLEETRARLAKIFHPVVPRCELVHFAALD